MIALSLVDAMAKFVSPLLGYNNNVRHKNRVFHIQTEDSGVNHPHIITHLFMDGGRILKSVKKSYAEHVGTEGMTEVVRQMMKEQHKAMFIALRDGQFDHLVDPNAASAAATAAPAAPAPPAEAAPAPPAEAAPAPPAEAAHVSPAAPAVAAAVPVEAKPEAQPAPAAAAAAIAPAAPPEPRLVVAAADAEPVPATTRQPEPPAAPPVSVDLDALERGSAPDSGFFQAHDLPPPPKNLFAKERGTGTYRAIEPEPENLGRPAPAPKPAAAASAAKSPQPGRVASRPPPSTRQVPGEPGRYAPARPAAIFGSTTKPQAQSIFSDDLVSDKSLDEVILSYLAEDLEPPRRK